MGRVWTIGLVATAVLVAGPLHVRADSTMPVTAGSWQGDRVFGLGVMLVHTDTDSYGEYDDTLVVALNDDGTARAELTVCERRYVYESFCRSHRSTTATYAFDSDSTETLVVDFAELGEFEFTVTTSDNSKGPAGSGSAGGNGVVRELLVTGDEVRSISASATTAGPYDYALASGHTAISGTVSWVSA